MIATNAFKQAVVGTYTASDLVIELNSISDTVGASDYLPNGGFNLILYDGLFGNPADANNAGKYEIFECSSVNYATNEVTGVRGVENTTAVTIDASSWQVVYGATKELLESLTSDWGDIGGTLSDQTDLQNALDAKIPTADIINDLTTGGATKVLSAEQGVEAKTLIDGKAPIQDTDTWVLTTSFTGNANPIATNLARFTHNFEKIGAGMTQASGVFTFPRTGIWRVEFYMRGDGGTLTQPIIHVITDASGTPVITVRASGVARDDGTSQAIFNGLKVTDTADIKVSFRAIATGAQVQGNSTALATYIIFTRIGDL